MAVDFRMLYQTGLFNGISQSEISAMLGCLNAKEVSYKKGEYIYREGDIMQEAGIILEGKVHLQQDDFWGNRNIIFVLHEGNMFGEVYSCLGNEKLQISIAAETDCRILLINLRKTMSVCKNSCIFHHQMIENLVFSIARKNLQLTEKIQHTSRRTIREKVLSYLSEESRRHGSSYFTIPFTRQQMADYLAVDRSALSKELAKMKDEGLVEYERNQFRLKVLKVR